MSTFRWIVILLATIVVAPDGAQAQRRRNAPRGRQADRQQQDREADGDNDDEIPHVVPAFDPGSHTRPIRALGFSSDRSRLITVGEDHSIQVWSVSTGERLAILRLPGFGHEPPRSARAWNIAAVSRDGRLVAIGGGQKRALSADNAADRAKLLLIDVERQRVIRLVSPRGAVTALAFSPQGDRLAAAYSGAPDQIVLYNETAGIVKSARPRQRMVTLTDPNVEQDDRIALLEFSPDGKRLLSAMKESLSLWNFDRDEPQVLHHLDVQGSTTAACWSADSRRFARAWTAFLQEPHGFEVRDADGQLERETVFNQSLSLGRFADPWGLQFLDPDTLLLSAYDRGRPPRQGAAPRPGAVAVRLDLKSDKAERLLHLPDQATFPTLGTLSADGEYAAIVVAMGLDVIVYRVRDGAVVARCGAESPIPTLVGWAAEGRPAGFAWSEDPQFGRNNTAAEDLQYGFDLTTMEPLADVAPADYVVRRDSIGEWNIARGEQPSEFNARRGAEILGEFRGGAAIPSMTLIPQPNEPPLVAFGSRSLLIRNGASVTLADIDGAEIAQLRPTTVHPRDLAPSPDGRFLIVSSGTHRLNLHTTDGEPLPLLSFARVKGEWVAWTKEGYFTSSPGGEKMIGWTVSNGHNELATFHTAERFARHFRRPELLKRAIQLGSVARALETEETRAPSLEEILPPRSELKLISQTAERVQVQATATPGAPDKPVVALRLLLDGRPMTGGLGSKNLTAGEPAEATWEFELPAGPHELKLLARSDDSSAVSEPLQLTGPKSASQQPVLHRLCVGLDEYQLSALNLTSAVKDATDVFGALEQYCVGADNRFGTAAGQTLLDQQATRAAVLEALRGIREAAQPGDLVVFHFAGHGIQQQDEYFLLTHEADPSASLQEHALSGADLRAALASMQCQVLLILDACHSARSVKAFRPATDELARNLTDDAVGVTVMAAAMSHEVATATEENGHFTAAVLKALQLGQGVPFDPYEHALYAHHIYSVVFTEVRLATKGKQNPFLNMPWTVPPIALRDVPAAP